MTAVNFSYYLGQALAENFVDCAQHLGESLVNETTHQVAWVAMGVWASYSFLDQGLANVLALKTYIHGTGPRAFVGICLNGADPSFGGGGSSEWGGGSARAQLLVKASKGYFHVFKDPCFDRMRLQSDPMPPIDLDDSESAELMTAVDDGAFYIRDAVEVSQAARLHAGISAMNELSPGTEALGIMAKVVILPSSFLVGLMTPSLKFHFDPEAFRGQKHSSGMDFEDDPFYAGAALRTKQPISAKYLGIQGSLREGLNSGVLRRMIECPIRVVHGAACLALSYHIAQMTYEYAMEATVNVTPWSMGSALSLAAMAVFNAC